MNKKKIVVIVLTLYVAFIFIQSLFFKFTNAPETQHIFGTLDEWAAGLGFGGGFSPKGLFSQYVIGSAELVASSMLLLGLVIGGLKKLQPLGGLMATGIMSGAIIFHLFTPLGVNVQGNGGLLFFMACGVWVSGLVIAFLTWGNLRSRA